MTYLPGHILLDKYRIEALIGQGTFGDVYCAIHLKLNQVRAIKVLRRDMPGISSEDFRKTAERFHFEAQLGAQLDHPNIIKVHDFEEADGELYLIMEYAPGGNLQDRLKNIGSLTISDTVRLGAELCNGLDALHSKLKTIHRDIKPSNILFGENGVAKIADLGLAQTLDGSSRRSQLGSLAATHPGTPLYMSPEQETTTAYLLPTSDVFSVGCVLFESLTGKPYKSVYGSRVHNHRADVPLWLDEIIVRALAEQPGRVPEDDANPVKRYRDMRQLRNALKQGWFGQTTQPALMETPSQPIDNLPLGQEERVALSRRLLRPITGIGAIAFLLLIFIIGLVLYRQVSASPDLPHTTPTSIQSSPTSQKTLLILTPTSQLTLMPTQTSLLATSPTPTALGGGSGRIVFTVNSSRIVNTDGIYTINVDGTHLVQLVSETLWGDKTPISATSPVWSPDGKQIAFLSNRDTKNVWDEIFLMNSDGSNQHRLTPHSARYFIINSPPIWSPDGKQIAFSGSYIRGSYLINVDGSNLVLLDSKTTPAWLSDRKKKGLSPDGKKIVYECAGEESSWNDSICTMNLDESAKVILAKGTQPLWSPDGQKIAFRGNDKSIYIIDADGGSITNLLQAYPGILLDTDSWRSWVDWGWSP